MKKIFLTGATGTMGLATLRELKNRQKDFEIVVLARNSKKNRRVLSEFQDMSGFSVIWGDLLDYNCLKRGVVNADYVLHLGGMVSPAADYYPEKTLRTNITGTRNLLRAVKETGGTSRVRFVFIGSIAQSGDNPAPDNWVFTFNRQNPSVGDAYALSKTLAEKCVTESGLKYWTSLRQTGILAPSIIKKGSDPITFHLPINDCLEWTTDEESANAMVNICEGKGDDMLWSQFFTIGGGSGYRLTSYEFEKMFLQVMDCPPPEKVFETKWFALTNFHGGWWGDSDRLENILHYRSSFTMEEYLKKLKANLPFYFRFAGIVPASIIKFGMKQVARKKGLGTLYWVEKGNEKLIKRHFGSLENIDKIPGWSETIRKLDKLYPPGNQREAPALTPEYAVGRYGWDASKQPSEINVEDLRKRASFLDGKLIDSSLESVSGDRLIGLNDILEWECNHGHKFMASVSAVLLGGHWCPECLVKNSEVFLPDDVAIAE